MSARCAAALLAAAFVACGAPAAAASPGPPPRVFAFLSWADGRELVQLQRHGEQIDVVAPNWYELDAGTAHVRGAPRRDVVALAAEAGAAVWPVVNARLARSKHIERRAWRAAVTAAVRSLAAAGRHAGMTLDMEELAPGQRRHFSALVRALANGLRADGRKLAVYAPRGDRAYDWRALAGAADLLVVSAYNEHWAGSAPGPITTSRGLAQVVRRAAAVDRRRVAVALGAFGYRWPAGRAGSLIAATEGERLARVPGARTVRRDGWARVRLPGGDVAFFETARGLRARVAAIRAARVRTVALFTLGREPERFWTGLDIGGL